VLYQPSSQCCINPPVSAVSTLQSVLYQPSSQCCIKPPVSAVSTLQSVLYQPSSQCCINPPVSAVSTLQSVLYQPSSQCCINPPVSVVSTLQSVQNKSSYWTTTDIPPCRQQQVKDGADGWPLTSLQENLFIQVQFWIHQQLIQELEREFRLINMRKAKLMKWTS